MRLVVAAEVLPDKRGWAGSAFEMESFRTVLGVEGLVWEVGAVVLVREVVEDIAVWWGGRRAVSLMAVADSLRVLFFS